MQLCEDVIWKADDPNENMAREHDIVETDKPTNLLAFRGIDGRELDQRRSKTNDSLPPVARRAISEAIAMPAP